MPRILPAVKRRTTPGEEAEPEDLIAPGVETEPPPPPPPPPANSPKLAFWDYIDNLSQEECERRTVIIYRYVGGKKEALPGKQKKYLAFIPLPMDGDGFPRLRQYIMETFGGGYYEIYLKVRVEGQRMAADEHHLMGFEVEGPSKYPMEVGPGGTVEQPGVVLAPGAAPAAAGLSNEAQLELIRAATAKPSQDDFGASAAKQAVATVVDILGAAAKKEAGSMSGNTIVDQLITKSLDRALNPPTTAPADPLSTLGSQLEALRKLNELINPQASRPAPRERAAEPVENSNPLAYAKDIAEALKIDPTGRFLDLLHGPEEAPGFSTLVVNYGLKALETRPDLPGQIADGIVAILGKVVSGLGGVPSASPVRRLGAAPAASNPAATPPATAAQPAAAEVEVIPPTTEEAVRAKKDAMIAETLRMLARAFKSGATGENAAYSLACLFPELIPDLRALLNKPEEMMALKDHPAISAISDDADFADFFVDFRNRVLAGFDDEGDDEEDGEDAEVPVEPDPAVAAAEVQS